MIFGLLCKAKRVDHGLIVEEEIPTVVVASSPQDAMSQGLRLAQSRWLPLRDGYYNHTVVPREADPEVEAQLRSLMTPCVVFLTTTERQTL